MSRINKSFFSVSFIEAIITHVAASLLKNLLSLLGVIVVLLNLLIVVNIALQWAVSGNAMAKQDGINNHLIVDGVADRRNDIFIDYWFGRIAKEDEFWSNSRRGKYDPIVCQSTENC